MMDWNAPSSCSWIALRFSGVDGWKPSSKLTSICVRPSDLELPMIPSMNTLSAVINFVDSWSKDIGSTHRWFRSMSNRLLVSYIPIVLSGSATECMRGTMNSCKAFDKVWSCALMGAILWYTPQSQLIYRFDIIPGLKYYLISMLWCGSYLDCNHNTVVSWVVERCA